jgi:hypothetical protein
VDMLKDDEGPISVELAITGPDQELRKLESYILAVSYPYGQRVSIVKAKTGITIAAGMKDSRVLSSGQEQTRCERCGRWVAIESMFDHTRASCSSPGTVAGWVLVQKEYDKFVEGLRAQNTDRNCGG